MLKNRTKIRRALQRATGTHFIHPTKTPTPLKDRAFVVAPVLRRGGDALPREAAGLFFGMASERRSQARIDAFIASGGIKK